MKRCKIKFYYSCRNTILAFILLSLLLFLTGSALFKEIATSDDWVSKILFILFLLVFTGLWSRSFYVSSKLIYCRLYQIPNLILNEKGLTANGIFKKEKFFIPWQEIDLMYIYNVTSRGITVNQFIIIDPIPMVNNKYGKKSWLNFYLSNLQINAAYLQDHIQDIFEIIEDYWKTNGEYDQEIIDYLHNCRKRRRQKKFFWLIFFSCIGLCFYFISQLK